VKKEKEVDDEKEGGRKSNFEEGVEELKGDFSPLANREGFIFDPHFVE